MTVHVPRVASVLFLGVAPWLLAAQAPRAVISGVPFISWEEAARLDYHDKDVTNPSMPAALGMILRYWGQDLSLLKRDHSETPQWAASAGGDHVSFDSLKQLVARGIPVVVFTSMTPFAHQVAPESAALATMVTTEGLKLGAGGVLQFRPTASQVSRIRGLMSDRGGFWSGVLGTMPPLDTFRVWEDSLRLPLRKESLFQAARVLIGYDEEKRVVVLHCPSFGPAWEVSYEDFDKMWSFMDRSFTTYYPKNLEQVRTAQPPAAAYPSRSARQLAATHFVYGYALARMGQASAATTELRAIQALGEVGKGYEHLAWLELGWVAAHRGDMDEAMFDAAKARELLPEHHRSWLLFSALFQSIRVGGEGHETAADSSSRQAAATDARRQAQLRCGDPKAKAVVAKTLPHAFATFGCDGLNPL